MSTTPDTRHLADDELVLQYYGELEPSARPSAEGHLDACGECRQRFARLQRVLAAVETLPEPALPDGFERTVWARLAPALPERRGWLTRFLLFPPNLAWAATIVLLVAGAFFAGRMSQPQPIPAPALTAEQVREGVLLADLTEHLHRSQTMLVELVTAELPEDDAGIDLRPERDRAGELVAANRLYRQSASASGDTALLVLLDDLERLLVELAASPDHVSERELERVRQRIAARDLLFKLRVVSDGVRERQRQQIQARSTSSES